MIETFDIPDLLLIKPLKFNDERGVFSETYNKQTLVDAEFDREFIQDNHSLSIKKGVVRGLHFQTPPYAQDKLVRVISGSILDVAVDIRGGSPTYGQHIAVELSAENWAQLLIPIGFAHGFCTLEPDTQVAYKVTAYYAPDHEGGLAWNDPDLGIDWPGEIEKTLSEKDLKLPTLNTFTTPFEFWE